MSDKLKLWFNDLDPSARYGGTEPEFITVDHFDAVREVVENLETCHAELRAYVSNTEMDPYFNTSLVEKEKDWQTIGLRAWAMPLRSKQRRFPQTMKILRKHPEVLTFSFNRLEPQSRIKAHCGDCNATYRIHIGLEVPEGLPNCGFRVKDQKKAWENGKAFGFIDAFEHEAWNLTDSHRYVILMDIIRPEFKHLRRYVCFRVLAGLGLQKVAYVFPFLMKSPRWFKQSIFFALQAPQKIIGFFGKR